MSPIAGVWTVFGCDTRFCAWRSTEPAENTNPENYPEVFRLKPEDLVTFPQVPAVPPLRQKTS
jgi:hypothetical protein